MATHVSPAVRLETTWFGRGLSEAARRSLAPLAAYRSFEADTPILTEGRDCDQFGVVLAGRVALRHRVPEKGYVTALTVEPGDIYGWSAVVPPFRSTTTAVAVDAVEALVFEAAALRQALAADDALAASLYPAVLAAVARRLSATRLQLDDLFGQKEVLPW